MFLNFKLTHVFLKVLYKDNNFANVVLYNHIENCPTL